MVPIRKIARGVPGEELGGIPRQIPRLSARRGQSKWTAETVAPMHAEYVASGIAAASAKTGLSDARLYQLFDKFDLPRGFRKKKQAADESPNSRPVGTAKVHAEPREAATRSRAVPVHAGGAVADARLATVTMPCPACGLELDHMILLRARR
jgi:hypothetical protein